MAYTWPPASKSAGFGDGSEKGDEPNRQRISFADFIARETGDPYAGWYAAQSASLLRKDYELRLYRMVRNQTYATDFPSNSPKLIWYKDAGEVAIHSESLFYQYSQWSLPLHAYSIFLRQYGLPE